MKRLVAILIFFSFFNFSAVEAQAEEVDLPIQSKELIYDMDKGGKQILEGLSPGGEKIIIEVEEIPNYFRSVKTGNYTISASMPGNWKASYRITVSNNKITRAEITRSNLDLSLNRFSKKSGIVIESLATSV